VHIKAAEEKAAMEKAAREKAAEDEAAGKENARIQEPEDSLWDSEASSANKEVDGPKQTSRFSFMKRSKIPIESTAYQLGSSPCKVMLVDDTDEVCMECKSKLEESDDINSTASTTTIPAGNEETKPTDVQSSRSCPCEWFICDDELSKIRNFVIQVCRNSSMLSDDSPVHACCCCSNLLFFYLPFEMASLSEPTTSLICAEVDLLLRFNKVKFSL